MGGKGWCGTCAWPRPQRGECECWCAGQVFPPSGAPRGGRAGERVGDDDMASMMICEW